MDLWGINMRNLPQGTNMQPFQEMDPMMAHQAMGNVPGGSGSPTDLRFLQLGNEMKPSPDDMILELISQLLSKMGGKK